MVEVPSPAEVTKARTRRGGWTRAQLAEWGVPWPPPRGWRQSLHELWEREQEHAKWIAQQNAQGAGAVAGSAGHQPAG